MANTGITVDDLRAELKQLRQTISDIETAGQSYSTLGRSFTRANLPAVQKREQFLIRAITRETDGMIMVGRVAGSADGPTADDWNNPDAP